MRIVEVVGDVFALPVPALAHGVNVDGQMGAGVAVGFRDRYPTMHAEYQTRCRTGTLAPGGLYAYRHADGRWVYNLATEDRAGAARLAWIAASLAALAGHARAHGITTVGTVRLGCGLGGLSWSEVRPVLAAIDAPVTLVVARRTPGAAFVSQMR